MSFIFNDWNKTESKNDKTIGESLITQFEKQNTNNTAEYNIADNIPTPDQIFVKNSIYDSIRGVQFYSDVIAYGNRSNDLLKEMYMLNNGKIEPVNFGPFGINQFVKTGQQCSNGADTYTYIHGIPKGDMFGKTIQRALKETHLPPLKGLGPGIIEDVKYSMDLKEIGGTLFGGAYPVCKEATLPVGDSRGNIVDKNGNSYLSEKGSFKRNDGLYYQTRWVESSTITRDQHDCSLKTHNPDGTPRKPDDIPNLPDECDVQEGFQVDDTILKITAIILCIAAISYKIF
jgi:hypothetical protein